MYKIVELDYFNRIRIPNFILFLIPRNFYFISIYAKFWAFFLIEVNLVQLNCFFLSIVGMDKFFNSRSYSYCWYIYKLRLSCPFLLPLLLYRLLRSVSVYNFITKPINFAVFLFFNNRDFIYFLICNFNYSPDNTATFRRLLIFSVNLFFNGLYVSQPI